MIEFSGIEFRHVDNRLMSLKLVELGLSGAAMFGPSGEVIQPAATSARACAPPELAAELGFAVRSSRTPRIFRTNLALVGSRIGRQGWSAVSAPRSLASEGR
jgi:hypothetical protein